MYIFIYIHTHSYTRHIEVVMTHCRMSFPSGSFCMRSLTCLKARSPVVSPRAQITSVVIHMSCHFSLTKKCQIRQRSIWW